MQKTTWTSKLRAGLATAAVAAVALFGATGAQAALLNGKTIQFTYLFPDINTIYPGTQANYVVGAGVEIPNGICCGEGSVDISDSNILVDFNSNQSYAASSFNGFRIRDILGTIDSFTSASINSITNMVGLTGGRVTFDANNIWVNWQGLSFTGGTIVSIDIGGGKVPEPGSLVLMGLALGALGFARRARR